MSDQNETLRRLAQQIRTAVLEGENTAEKVGRVLTGILDKIEIEELARIFLRKDQNDETAFLVKFFNGIETGEYIQGESGSTINYNGDAELRSLVVRIKALATELEVTDKATTMDLLVKNLAEIHNLDVDNLAILFRTVVKDYVKSEDFVSGFAGEGMKLEKTLSGDWEMELDRLTIRKTMRVFELLISKIRAVNGGLVVSPANGKIKEVTEPEDEPGLYKLVIDGDARFVADDLVRCQVFTGNLLKHYWVPVKRVNEDSIFVAKSDFPEDTSPEPDDEIVLMGNISDTSRQGCLFLSATDDGKPRIQVLNGINSPSLAGKNKTIIGCLDGIEDTYFKEDQPQGYGLYSDNAYLKGDFILKNSGKSVESYIKATEDSIRLTVKEIQVGGRNYVRNSGKTYTGQANEWWGYDFESQEFPELRGKSVVLSAEGRVTTYTGNYTQVFLRFKSDGSDDHGINFDQIDFKREYLLVDIPEDAEMVALIMRNVGNTATGEIRKIKLEVGNKPTDWTPAPEDVEKAIEDIDVGGRNLMLQRPVCSQWNTGGWIELNSDWGKSTPSHKMINASGEGTYRFSFPGIQDPGWYSVSFFYKHTQGAVLNFNVEINDHKVGNIYEANVEDTWKKFEGSVYVTNYVKEHGFVDFEVMYSNWFYLFISDFKVEKGNKPTDWTPAPEDQASKTELLDTGIDITSKQITLTADKTKIQNRNGTTIADFFTEVNGKPLIKATNIDVDNLIVKKLDAQEATIGGTKLFRDANGKPVIQSGNIDAERLEVRWLRADTAIVGGTEFFRDNNGKPVIKADNIDVENLEVVKLKGASGSFKELSCINNAGTEVGAIKFNDSKLCLTGDITHQGRFYMSNAWVSGSFGAHRRTAIVIHGAYGYIYTNGLNATGASRTQINFLKKTQANRSPYYTIPLYGIYGDYSDMPIDLVVIQVASGRYRYELENICGKKVTVVNADDVNCDVSIVCNDRDYYMEGGCVAEFINVNGFLNPIPPYSTIGRGWLRYGYNNNDWH